MMVVADALTLSRLPHPTKLYNVPLDTTSKAGRLILSILEMPSKTYSSRRLRGTQSFVSFKG